MARLALVTGGARGLGAAISVALKDAGFRVVANDDDPCPCGSGMKYKKCCGTMEP